VPERAEPGGSTPARAVGVLRRGALLRRVFLVERLVQRCQDLGRQGAGVLGVGPRLIVAARHRRSVLCEASFGGSEHLLHLV
jgi:hypothetical protein